MRVLSVVAAFLWLALFGLEARAKAPDDITDAEWALVPSYCPDTLGFRGHSINKGKWEAVMGRSFYHMHHYCWARISLMRAQRARVGTRPRQDLITASEIDLLYVTRNAEEEFVLLPEVYTWLGRTQLMLRKPADAGKAFAKARQLKPDYWPAYSEWAEFLRANGNKPEALTVLKTGLQHSPDAKVLKDLFRLLGGRPEDIPPPIVQSESPPAPPPPQQGSEQSPATGANPPDQR